MGDDDCTAAYLHVYHGRHFENEPFFLYAEGVFTDVKMYLDYMSVEDIKNGVVELGYTVKRLKTIYFRKPNVLFEERCAI